MIQDDFSYLGGMDIQAIDNLYSAYQKDPESVDQSWREFFKGFDFARSNFSEQMSSVVFDKEFKVINLIDAYRKRGHLFTKTNPVRIRRRYFPTLDVENYELSESDLETEFHAGRKIGLEKPSLKEILEHLKQTYCESIGAEYMFIRSPEKLEWLSSRMESSRNTTEFTEEQKKHLKKNQLLQE